MAQRSALVGRFAEASLNGTLIALLFDWSVTIDQKIVELTAHGDFWEYNVPTVAGWTFRAKGYIIPASAAHYLNTLWAANALPGTAGYVTVAGFSGSVAGGTKIFEGSGVPMKGTISASMEMAEQEWEIKGHGAPTAGV